LAEATRERGAIAPEIPSKNLPPVEYREMPEPLPLRRIVGPGVIITATSLGSGEYVLWPYIASQVGLVVMWAAVIGVLTQFFINMEVERYTIATGETAITGFTRLWKPWWVLFIGFAILPNIWPGFVTSSVTALTFVLGLGEGAVIPLAIIALISVGIALTISPVVYQFVERFQMVAVTIMVVFFAFAVVAGTNASDWADLGAGFANFGRIPGFGLPPSDTITAAVILGALAFAGGGGCNNLTISNWIRDKGFGMGRYIPRIVSPVTGEEESLPSTGYFFPQDEENIRRFRGWWRVANLEQFFTFFVIGTTGIIVLSLLAYSTVFNQDVGEGLDFIRAEGETLQRIVAPWFGVFFWLAGFVILFSTTIGNFDYVSRITADQLKVNALRDSAFFSESKLYAMTVWLLVLSGITIILTITEQPIPLLVISSVLSAFVMFVYSILLIVLNRGVLPRAIGIGGVRLGAMIWSTLFFGIFSAVVIYNQIISPLFGLPPLLGGE
jgi:hypothetical protein